MFGVGVVGLVGVAIAEEGDGEAGGTDFGGGVGVGHRPPEVHGLDAGGFFERGGHLLTDLGGRRALKGTHGVDDTQHGRNDPEAG